MHTVKSETVPVTTYNNIIQPGLLWIPKTGSYMTGGTDMATSI